MPNTAAKPNNNISGGKANRDVLLEYGSQSLIILNLLDD